MNSLKLEHARCLHAFNSLQDALLLHKEALNLREKMAYKDSVTRRFDRCFDLMWKYIKLSLEQKSVVFKSSPRDVFKTAALERLITESESSVLLIIVDARNMSAHEYNLDQSHEIRENIESFHNVMKTILERL